MLPCRCYRAVADTVRQDRICYLCLAFEKIRPINFTAVATPPPAIPHASRWMLGLGLGVGVVS